MKWGKIIPELVSSVNQLHTRQPTKDERRLMPHV